MRFEWEYLRDDLFLEIGSSWGRSTMNNDNDTQCVSISLSVILINNKKYFKCFLYNLSYGWVIEIIWKLEILWWIHSISDDTHTFFIHGKCQWATAMIGCTSKLNNMFFKSVWMLCNHYFFYQWFHEVIQNKVVCVVSTQYIKLYIGLVVIHQLAFAWFVSLFFQTGKDKESEKEWGIAVRSVQYTRSIKCNQFVSCNVKLVSFILLFHFMTGKISMQCNSTRRKEKVEWNMGIDDLNLMYGVGRSIDRIQPVFEYF